MPHVMCTVWVRGKMHACLCVYGHGRDSVFVCVCVRVYVRALLVQRSFFRMRQAQPHMRNL